MTEHTERPISQIDAGAGPIAQFLLPKIEGQIGYLDQVQSAQAAA
jgi:hypothetical protein